MHRILSLTYTEIFERGFRDFLEKKRYDRSILARHARSFLDFYWNHTFQALFTFCQGLKTHD